MKLKEVCERTGLSRKTIRLYEEKGLLVPHKETINGREYRDYTELDIQRLKTIALLRRAWFTMDEIKQMQENPEAIREIFPQYRLWLRQQKRELDELIAVAEQVQLQDVETIGQLTERMAVAAAKLPLPKMDRSPHFRHLDAMEEPPRNIEPEWKNPLAEGIADNRAYRQFVASSSKTKHDDLAVAMGQFHEAVQMFQETESGPVTEKVEVDSNGMTALKWLFLGLAIVSGIFCCWFRAWDAEGALVMVMWVVFGAAVVIRILLGIVAWRSRRRRQRERRERLR